MNFNCPMCGKPITAGQSTTSSDHRGFVHQTCKEQYFQSTEERLQRRLKYNPYKYKPASADKPARADKPTGAVKGGDK